MPFRADALVGVQGKCSVLGASELASAVPCPSGKALPRSVMSICRERSTMRSTCRATRSRSLSSRSGDVWTWDNLPIDVLNLMPKRGDDQFLDVWSRDAGDAAGFVLAVLQHGLRDIVAIAHVAVARAWLAETAKLRARQIGEFEVTRPDAEPG